MRKSIQISEFKARCIESLRDVDRTGQSLLVTVRGKPIAVVEPVTHRRKLGAMQGECEILVDLVRTDFADEWEINR